jgi:hypothetical protein
LASINQNSISGANGSGGGSVGNYSTATIVKRRHNPALPGSSSSSNHHHRVSPFGNTNANVNLVDIDIDAVNNNGGSGYHFAEDTHSNDENIQPAQMANSEPYSDIIDLQVIAKIQEESKNNI